MQTSLKTLDVLRQIIGAGSDFVSIHHRTGEVDDCSISSHNFHGLEHDDLLAGGFLDRVHIADRPACLGAFSRASHGDEKVRTELRLRCPSSKGAPDHFCWIELSCSMLASVGDEEASEEKILCVARDISHWKEREEELVARQQMAQEQIEAKARFLSNMSHELRTPLNAIIGFSEMMKLPGMMVQNEQQMVEYAGIIHDSGRHLLKTIDDVLEMSKLEAGEYKLDSQFFAVGELIADSVEIVQSEAQEKAVRLVLGDLEDGVQMLADQRACKQALVGLMAAQIKQLPVRGTMYLTCRREAGGIEFVVASAVADRENEGGGFHAGSQVQKFVDLLQGRLYGMTNAAGQHEVVLQIPTGQSLVTGSKGDQSGDDNIVSIDEQPDCMPLVLKKTA